MFARCTSVVEMAPSSIGAFKSSCLRLRTASMKLAQWLPPSLPGARVAARAQEALIAAVVFVPDREVALGAVEDCADGVAGLAALADAGFVVGHPVAHLEFHHLLLAALVEFEGGVQGVGRLLVVVEHEVAADGADLGRILHAQAPARDIHLVDALVADVAVAVVPEPVPVVVEAILRELVLGRGAEPQVVVDAGGHRLDRLAADGVAPLEAEAAGHVDVADQAVAHLLDGFAARLLERLWVPCCTMRLYFCAAATICFASNMLCEQGFST